MTHRVAISNRLVSFQDDKVVARWRDSAHKNKKRLLTLFVRVSPASLLLHVLRGFVFKPPLRLPLQPSPGGRLLPLCKQMLARAPFMYQPWWCSPEKQGIEPSPLWTPLCGGSMTGRATDCGPDQAVWPWSLGSRCRRCFIAEHPTLPGRRWHSCLPCRCEHSISRTASRFASVARPLTVIRRLHAHCGPPVTQPGPDQTH